MLLFCFTITTAKLHTFYKICIAFSDFNILKISYCVSMAFILPVGKGLMEDFMTAHQPMTAGDAGYFSVSLSIFSMLPLIGLSRIWLVFFLPKSSALRYSVRPNCPA